VIEPAVAPTANRRIPGPPLRVEEARANAPDRAELEAFVREAFARKHDACVASFMPALLSFRDAGGELRGVIGLRDAQPQPLYLEQYLAQPIEAAIGAAAGMPVRRNQVIEVGNLAGTSCRAAVRMVAMLPSYLLARDYRWIVFTATSAVRSILQGFGAPLVELARADGSRVSDGPDHWGRYYDNDPRVLAGYLPHSRRLPGFTRGPWDR